MNARVAKLESSKNHTKSRPASNDLRPSKSSSWTISSPDGNIVCKISLIKGQVFYHAFYYDTEIVHQSLLGLEIAGLPHLNSLKFADVKTSTHTETITMPWGDTKYINNNYHELVLSFKNLPPKSLLPKILKTSRSIRSARPLDLTLRFRIFDDTVAFRYEIKAGPDFRRAIITDELTEFNINNNSTIYSIPAYQRDRYEYSYVASRLSDLDHAVHTPLTIKIPNNLAMNSNLNLTSSDTTTHATTPDFYLSIHEAALYDYGAMNLKPSSAGYLSADITPLSDHTRAHVDLPFQTPWRCIMLARSAANLTGSHTIYALNPAPRGDFSWVQTLKFLGIWWAMYVGEYTWAPGANHGATTAHAKEYIDACVRLGIKGLLIEGWNDAWQGDWLENGPNNNFTAPTPDFNLPEVARYAALRDVELIGHHETVGYADNYEAQLEDAYNYYAANSIHYVKTGYANEKMLINGRHEYHYSQAGVQHYQKTIELAAKKHICLDIHEPIKGTGIERTWPNLLTREGARGQEYEGGTLTPSHACFLPYTRLLAGGMDYTNAIFDLKNPIRPIATTITRQIAYFVVIYSGMSMAADRPRFYEKDFPKLADFIRKVPTDFEISLPLFGEIGEYYVVARKDRNSDNWYVGGITNEDSRNITLDFNFLPPGRFHAKIYQDALDADYRTNPFAHEIVSKNVTHVSKLEIFLAPGGGFVIELKSAS
ncbi:glycoside hydrolase family 97 protein [Candidatus Saccharibacteria bacterium]|nr:glycoside hydrolase family 97 protein [Candidatus Saccharibacteria bacterium]